MKPCASRAFCCMDTALTVDLCVEARHVVPVDRPGLVLTSMPW